MNNPTTYQKLIQVRQRIAELKEMEESLQLELMDEMDSENTRLLNTEIGIFKIMGRKTWDYSGAVRSKQEELRLLKKKEELDGTATVKSDSRYIRFDPPKGEDNGAVSPETED